MIEKLDVSAFVTPAARASQNGVGINRTMMMVNKINEIMDALGTVAIASTVAAINTQVNALALAQSSYLNQMTALTKRVGPLEFPIQDAIADVSQPPLTVGVDLNFLNAQAGQVKTNTTAINQILTVMRNRKEIKP